MLADHEFKLIKDEHGQHVWTFGNIKKEIRKEVIRLLDEEIDQKTISETLGISKGRVSQIKTQAIKDGLLSKKGKLTPSGFDFING